MPEGVQSLLFAKGEKKTCGTAYLAEIGKQQTAQGAKAQKRVLERLYAPKRQMERILEMLHAQTQMQF